MSDEQPQTESEGSIGQSVSTAGLERMAFGDWWKTITELRNEQTSASVGGFIHVRMAFEAGARTEREACAKIAETPVSGEQDDITMEAKDRIASEIRARSNMK